jgi:formate dehydrogenase subunit gamma
MGFTRLVVGVVVFGLQAASPGLQAQLALNHNLLAYTRLREARIIRCPRISTTSPSRYTADTHWLAASTFLVLAASGLNITFGKFVIQPWLGDAMFGPWSQFAKFAHNYLSFPFMLGVVLMLLIWIKDNIPNGDDVAWFKAGGGLIGDQHPPAARFNGGQKMIFWSVILGGAALTVSGLMLLFPFRWAGLEGLQLSNIVHGIVGMLMIAAMLAHIYIGSVGMEGAFDAMGTGEVDLNWAKEHHSIWVEEEMAKRAGLPAGGKPMAAE